MTDRPEGDGEDQGFAADCDRAIGDLLSPLGLTGEDRDAARLHYPGEIPRLAARHKLTLAAAAAIGAQASVVAALWRHAGGPRQTIAIDKLQATAALHPALFQRQGGAAMPALLALKELKSDFYKTADGRWFFPVGTYAHHRDGALNLLNCANNAEAIAAAVARWEGLALEEAWAEARLPGIMARTAAEWAEHPQGQLLAAMPTISIRRIGDAPPEPLPRGERPLSGLRVLDVSHVIAGPAAARGFAEHGADVLRVSAPLQPDPTPQILNTGIGKRSAYLDLKQADQAERARGLLAQADVFVQSWRPGAMERLGFGAERAIEARPGLIYVTVSAFGTTGPWGARGGFEQLGQAAAGVAIVEGEPGKPRLVPTYLLNDYLTAYLATTGGLAALLRRQREGGGWHVHVSLARTSMWVRSLGLQDHPANPIRAEDMRPALETRDSPFGELQQVPPVAGFSDTSAHWALPPQPLGASAPVWLAR